MGRWRDSCEDTLSDRVTSADFLWGRAEFWPPGARRRGALWLLIIFGTYLAAIKLYPWSSGVAVVWVPNAIVVTALLYFRPRDWVYVCAPGLPAEVVGDLMFNYAPTKSLALGVVNAAEAVLVVVVAAYIAGGRRNIGLLSVRGTLALVVASVMVPGLTGWPAALVLTDWSFVAEGLTQWRTWWFGDSTGLLVGIPIGLLLRDARFSIARVRSRLYALSIGTGTALLTVVAAALALNGNAWGAQQIALGAAILLALAFGAVGAPIAAMATATVTIIGVARGFDGIGSIPVNQILLFTVVSAIYAIAATTEVADRAIANRDLAQSSLKSELDSAARYVTALLPVDFDGIVRASSRHLPSKELGGDCFDFGWIDDDHLVFWVVDVSGHGVAPALMSVSVHDMLRSLAAGSPVATRPQRVLSELNRRFSMDRHDGHYLTIWYGVYRPSTRTLTYAGAGHPPALLLTGGRTERLWSQAPPVGMFDDTEFTSASLAVPTDSEVLLYSDGAFDLHPRDGESFNLEGFIQLCAALSATSGWNLDALVSSLRARATGGRFEDDCSLVRLVFGAVPDGPSGHEASDARRAPQDQNNEQHQ